MTASAYASVPYPAAPVRDAHPARLLALAALAGLGPPPPVERWRVLEVGCSDATEVPARPLATSLARAQAESGGAVANLRHALVRLGDEERRIVALLDGTREVREVAREAGVSEERAREALAWVVRAALLQRDDAATASRKSRNPSPIAP